MKSCFSINEISTFSCVIKHEVLCSFTKPQDLEHVPLNKKKEKKKLCKKPCARDSCQSCSIVFKSFVAKEPSMCKVSFHWDFILGIWTL